MVFAPAYKEDWHAQESKSARLESSLTLGFSKEEKVGTF